MKTDVEEIDRGLPQGALLLQPFFAAGVFDDAAALREVLERTRNKLQDLRVAKSTFFALLSPKGTVLRSDQQPDLLAGRDLVASFPELKRALAGESVRTRGQVPEAATVRGRSDGQWVAVEPIRVDGQVRGAYATGWSWSAYAYRLENQLRSSVRSLLKPPDKEPLLYVYVLVDNAAFYAPVSPDVNAKVVLEERFFAAVAGPSIAVEREITGRDFGIAFARQPALGPNVGVAVLRSET